MYRLCIIVLIIVACVLWVIPIKADPQAPPPPFIAVTPTPQGYPAPSPLPTVVFTMPEKRFLPVIQ